MTAFSSRPRRSRRQKRSCLYPNRTTLPPPSQSNHPSLFAGSLTWSRSPLIALATAGFGCISLLCGLWDKSGRQQHFIAHLWARTLLLISLSPVKIVGREKLHEHETAVYASNHLSYMDTPVLFAKLPFQFRILAKQSLWKVPFIGWYLNRSGQVPVDSNSPRSLVASLNRGVATVKHGLPLVLFPEGGRAATGQLQTMMSGCAYMAIKAQVPLIPLTLVGTYELLPIHVYALHPTSYPHRCRRPHPHDWPNIARCRRPHPAHLRVHLHDLRAVHPEPLAWVSLGACRSSTNVPRGT